MVKSYQTFELFDKLIFEKVILEPPFTAVAEMHNEACFIYAVQGKANAYSGEGTTTFESMEGVVAKCGNYFNEWLAISDCKECEAIAIHFYPEVLQKIYEKEFPDFIIQAKQEPVAALQKVKADELLSNYIQSLQFYFENPALVSEELLKIKIKELILLLAKTDNADAIKDVISSFFTPSEYSFKEVIENNIYSNLTNEQLATLCHMSLSSFKREFERIYRTSPAKYFKQRKLDRAANLLANTQKRIGDIAYECGFREISHFSKSFQKAFGKSPSAFRAG